MPKLKNYGPGKRYNLWVPARLIPTLEEIENHSKFLQIALEQAVGVMQWAMMKERAPEQYFDTGRIEDVIDQYNERFPLDPLTKQRYANERAQRSDQTGGPQSHNELW